VKQRHTGQGAGGYILDERKGNLVLKSHTRVQGGRPLPPRAAETIKKPLPQPRDIEDVTSQISACIEELTAAGYHETAAMLAIARLDLLARRHGITEDELQYIMTAPRRPALQTEPSD
jgi:hypothetical protein